MANTNTTKIIETVNRLMPNAYGTDIKLGWLEELEAKIRREVYQTHLDAPEQPQTNDLSVPEAFAGDVYVPWLQAKIAWHNEEDARYDRYITKFNDGYERFRRWYNETHTPIPLGEFWRF